MTSCHHLVLLLVWMGHIYGEMSDNNTNQTEVADINGSMSGNSTNQTDGGSFVFSWNWRMKNEWDMWVARTKIDEEKEDLPANLSHQANASHHHFEFYGMKRDLQITTNSNKSIFMSPDYSSWYLRHNEIESEDELNELYEQIQPLYKHLHAYVRRNLMKMYGNENFPNTGHIPAHLLGDNMAKRWDRLIDDLAPFKNKPSTNVTDEMLKQNYTYLEMYELADDYLGSLGLARMPEEFWNNSLLYDPNDGRGRVCDGQSWDFYDEKDYRIAMCTGVYMDYLDKVFEMMGRTEFSIQRKDLPFDMRAIFVAHSKGLYSAIGYMVSLSALTPQFLHQVGLMPDFEDDYETNINYLMRIALLRVASMPLFYFHDQFTFDVFHNNTPWEEQNQFWWQERCKHQGIFPAVNRSSSNLDYIADESPEAGRSHTTFFAGIVLAFQFHEAICNESGHTGPIHKCNIYNNKTLNTTLSDLMRSENGLDALERLTGKNKTSIQPMLNFFAPLLEYLQAENENEPIGWDEDCPNSITIA